ncbi:MAG: prolipoprotein diacylglyceryl transferase [Spirochaetaceae bacterium]|nr:prolipoprotein diacylglyceryl transferase [Spirochaetaceae bacterium]
MLAMINFPAWLKPEIVPGLPFRWYGLMYVVAFMVTWLLFRYESKRTKKPWTEELSANFFLWAIVGILLGGRLAGTLIYEPTDYYWRHPWMILWPFDESGAFVGYQGMSFHGGLVGLIVATLIWCKVRKEKWLEWADLIAISAPLGYTFGRLGNFINGELWGKVTAAPWGMVFPNAPSFAANQPWVQEYAAKAGIPINAMTEVVNLPRHPSQLYEALFEGLLLWLVLWFIARKRRPFAGFNVAAYIIGYGTARFFIEYFREPDPGLGYIIKLGDPDAPTYLFTTPFNYSMGQILCFMMIVAGGLLMYLFYKRSKLLQAESTQTTQGAQAGPGATKNAARKRRKQIK